MTATLTPPDLEPDRRTHPASRSGAPRSSAHAPTRPESRPAPRPAPLRPQPVRPRPHGPQAFRPPTHRPRPDDLVGPLPHDLVRPLPDDLVRPLPGDTGPIPRIVADPLADPLAASDTQPLPALRPLTALRPRPVRPPLRRARRDLRWPDWQWRLFLGVATLATLGLHLFGLDTVGDLFVDEPFYVAVGQSIARGGMPHATGSYFFLHPPGFFYVEAGWIKLFGLHDQIFAQVFSLRRLVAVFAAGTALMLGVVVAKAVGRSAAAIVVVIYAINAFANRDSSQVILEPATLFWTLSGYAVFVHLGAAGSARRARQIAVAGLLFGIAAFTKEFAVFVTLLPLGLAFVFRCWLTRREAVRAMVWTAVPWGIWLLVVAATGHWSEFVAQITSGFHRTTGGSQISGFNAPGRPSFLETIISNLDFLWTAYAVLGLGSLAILHVFRTAKGDQRLRFLSLFGLGAIPLLAYCVTLGTNEEQFFNFLFFPALICLVAAVWQAWPRLRRPLRAAVLVLLAAALVSDTAEYVNVHTHRDDGTYQIDRWMAEHVPVGTAISTTNPVQRQIFLRYTMVDDAPNTTLRPDIRYLIVFGKQVDQGYAFVDRATVDRQTRGQLVVFSTEDRSNGRMVIYAID